MGVFALVLMASAAEPERSRMVMKGAEDFDLARPVPDRGCATATDSEILVCGRRRKNDEIRVRDAGRFEQKPLKAETRLGGASLDVHAEQRSLPDGRSGPAALVRIRIPF